MVAKSQYKEMIPKGYRFLSREKLDENKRLYVVPVFTAVSA